MTFREVVESHPQPTGLDRGALLRCISECLDCAASCTSCADADLAEDDVQEMVRCIRLCLDCADACDATGRIVTRNGAGPAPHPHNGRSLCRRLPRLCGGVRPARRPP
jgi:hypothetical protein